VYDISVGIPKEVRSIGVRSSGMWICGARALESWRPEMKQGWYSGYEAGTGNVARVKVGYENDNTLRAEQARGYRNGKTMPTLPASLGRMSVTIPHNQLLRERILYSHHDTPLAGHPGRSKTVELIQRTYWWPGLSGYAARYVHACGVCQRTKPRVGAIPAPLQPNDGKSSR